MIEIMLSEKMINEKDKNQTIEKKDEKQMQKKTLFKRKRWVFIGIILFSAAISLLGACEDNRPPDAGENQNPPPTVKDEKPLIPDSSWDCGMPGGIPSPESGELVFEADMTLGDIQDVGQTQYGQRHVLVISGGTVSGPDISAEVLDGGLDYQLTLSNGAMEIDQINTLKTSDGAHIYFRSCGASASTSDVRIVPDFEAPNSSAYSFLNTGKFVGTREVDLEGGTMKLKVYDVSNVEVDSSAAGVVKVAQPNNVPDQSWSCQETDTKEKGDKLFTETVTLGKTITVGDSKYGERKIMPITGGSIASGGKIAGKVLFGGADYQIYGSTSTDVYVDARYTIETDDGELIIVRNCGPLMPLMTLAPSFETRKDGNYSYLNDGRWQSGFPMPNLRQTQVKINIFEYP